MSDWPRFDSDALDRWLTTEPEPVEDVDELSYCPACGSAIDYCQGHGQIGDPEGFRILCQHDAGDHSECSRLGCEEGQA